MVKKPWKVGFKVRRLHVKPVELTLMEKLELVEEELKLRGLDRSLRLFKHTVQEIAWEAKEKDEQQSGKGPEEKDRPEDH